LQDYTIVLEKHYTTQWLTVLIINLEGRKEETWLEKTWNFFQSDPNDLKSGNNFFSRNIKKLKTEILES